MSLFEIVKPPELTRAVTRRDLQRVKQLLGSRNAGAGDSTSSRPLVDINEKSDKFPTAPLHAAVQTVDDVDEKDLDAVEREREKLVRDLLAQPGINVNITDGGSCTPLILAARRARCNLNIFKLLYEFDGVDKDTTNTQGEDVLMCAAKAGHLEIVKYLLKEQKLNNFGEKNEFGYTAVGLAAGQGHLEVVKVLTNTQEKRNLVEINAKSEDTERTLLILASLSSNVELLRYVLAKWKEKIDVNARDSSQKTALMLAAGLGYTNIVKELCNHGANVTLTDKENGYNALMLACIHGDDEVVEVLLKQEKTDITVTDHFGRNALFLAANMHKEECIKVILESERFSIVANSLARAIIAQTGGGDIVRFLSRVVTPQPGEYRPLSVPLSPIPVLPPPQITLAATRGDLDEVKRLLRAGADINAKSDQIPYTPLHATILVIGNIERELKDEKDENKRREIEKRLEKYEQLVQYLLQHSGTDVNATDSVGDTPLILAAKVGNVNILKALFEIKDVDKDATNEFKEDALMRASQAGNLASVRYILGPESGMPNLTQNFARKNERGYTAIHLATIGGHTEIVKLLDENWRLKYSTEAVDTLMKTEKDRTLLMLAALSGEKTVVEFWLTFWSEDVWREQIEGNVTDKNGKTALMLAAAEGNTEIVQLCCMYTDVTLASKDNGFNALMLACINGHHKTVKCLLNQEKTDIKATDHLGKNALFLAAEKSKAECVKAILECDKFNGELGSVVNAPTKTGDMTALTVTTDPKSRLQLIEKGGYDVRTILPEQTILRANVRQAIIDGGQDVWSIILNKESDITLPVFVLMAETKENEKTNITDDFWKFVQQNVTGRKYLSGEMDDNQGNTVFHFFAKCKCVAACRDQLPWNQLDLAKILEKQNEQKNTFLHVAAQSGCLKDMFEIVNERTEKTQEMIFHQLRDALKKENSDRQTFLAVALNSGTEEEDVYVDILETLRKHRIGYSNFKDICRSHDIRNNTLLHVAAKRSRCKTISYLADKPIDEGKNVAGLNPLHIAVQENNPEVFDTILKTFKHRIGINEPTDDNETVLHIAAKQGNVEMLGKIVSLGGDLSLKDNDGHTPLHDCLQQVFLEGGSTIEERCHKFKDVWNKVVEVAVIWWCGPEFLNVPVPNEDAHRYLDYKRAAVYYLRSLVRNVEGLSVLQFAARLGLVHCVATMLTQEHIFVKRKKYDDNNEDKGEFEIEITNLCPEYVTDFTSSKEYEHVKTQLEKKHRQKQTTFVETLAEVKPPLKASQILQCVPMYRLTKRQWHIYQNFGLVWLLLHCIIMGIASFMGDNEINYSRVDSSSDFTQSANETNGTAVAGKSVGSFARKLAVNAFDIFLPIYATVIFLLMVLLPLYLMGKKKYRKRQDEKSRRSHFDEPTYKLYHEYTEDKGVILSLLTYVMRKVIEYIKMVLISLFFVFSWWQYVVKSEDDARQYAWVKGTFLLVGWLLVLIPGRTYGPIYNFLSTLQAIIIKDMLPFILFYLTITMAFSCAIQLQFQLLSTDTTVVSSGLQTLFDSLHKVMYELIVITTGMDTNLKHIQEITDQFHEDYLSSTFIRTLLITYAIISVIVLLNMLIAMMGTTLSRVMNEEGEGAGWRQYQVSQTLWIRNFLISCKLFKLKIFGSCTTCCTCCGRFKWCQYKQVSQNPQAKAISHSDHPNRTIGLDDWVRNRGDKLRRDDDTNRWYLTLKKVELKDIRVKHWQQMTVEEINRTGEEKEVGKTKTTVDETDNKTDVKDRITSVENNIEAMQEVLNTLKQCCLKLKSELER